jgi:hypothetical protein
MRRAPAGNGVISDQDAAADPPRRSILIQIYLFSPAELKETSHTALNLGAILSGPLCHHPGVTV